MATIYEVSKLAGVSVSSVSRAINDHPHVSDKTKQKVKKAMDQLGFRPNNNARSLASNRSNSIGILVSQLNGHFYGNLITGIEAQCRIAEKHAIIAAGHGEQESEVEGIQYLIARGCDALILNVEDVSDEYLVELSKTSIPFVIINRRIPQLADRCIYLDDETGGYQATRFMLEFGHREIAYISGPLFKPDALARLNGHKKALKEYGIKFDEELFYQGDFEINSGIEGMQDLLARGVRFSGVVCANDEMAAGAMRTAREQNVDIPKQCSIMGFDNIQFASYLSPQLSTINNPVEEMGSMATRWVLKNVYQQANFIINNEFHTDLVIRESVAQFT